MLGNYDKIRKIQKLNEDELKHNIPLSGSWHSKYKDSAYIYIGNFPYELTEGDLVIICSQYGEVVDCRIARDKEAGNSKGFGFICYEDQRSTILAVDNLNGANIVGRQIRVDHVEQYKIPREYFELESDDDDDDGDGGNYDKKERYKPTGPDGKGWGKYRILSEEDKEMFRKMEEEEGKRMERQREGFVYKENIKDKEEEWESKFNEIVNDKKEKIEKYLMNKHHRHKHHHHHKHKHHHHHHKHKHDE